MTKPPFEINDRIINMLADIMNKLGGLNAALNKKMNLHLRKASVIKTVNSSCAIEANTLTEQQVEWVIEGKRVIAPPKEMLEVKNAYNAYMEMDRYDPYGTTSFLKAHKTLMDHLAEDAGRYRAMDVAVYDRDKIVHMGARPQFVPGLMDDLFKWARSSELNPIIKACVVHFEIETIHPFSDGNGRMGRLWQSVILCRYNELFKLIPTETLVYKHQQRYYDVLMATQRDNDSTLFIEFMMEMILETIDEYGDWNRMHKIKNEYIRDLTKGDRDVLMTLISNFDVDDVISAGRLSELTGKSDPTVRRHLKKFTDERILFASGEGKGRTYSLNKDLFS